ncbi:MAG TPA: carbon-nitrogen hydrolase family protein [bacterium]|nr:carbon-nitrogen hydrolase family protein [bacterium]
MTDKLRVAIAQIAPVWLDRDRTLAKMLDWSLRAADAGVRLVVFGEALVPGYPWWVEHTDGARFDDPRQKTLFAHYADQACEPEHHFGELAELAQQQDLTIVFGCMERAVDRGGHSLYCSLVTILPNGLIQPTHRKLMPTHEERLVWAQGDGHGLRVHKLQPFTMGGLNCWENWMPLPRAALHAQGEDLHVALWPGNRRNTEEITRFLAREGRSYVISAAALMRREDIADGVPFAAELRAALPEVAGNGGSCIAGPDTRWVIEPVTEREDLLLAELDHAFVRRERHNFDVSGHYARPEILSVQLDPTRHRTLWLRRD